MLIIKKTEMKKMNTFFVIILLMLTFNLKSQSEWAPTGAVWHFSKPLLDYPNVAYNRFSSIGDTTINTHSCKIIEQFMPIDAYGNLVNYTTYLFTYSDSNRIYIFKDNTFSLLYDFNKIEGEYWVNNRENDTIFVDSVGVMEINGISLNTQYIHNRNNWYISFAGLVIERIGWTGYFYPFSGEFAPPEGGPIRCYQDDSISYQVVNNCDSVSSAIGEYLQDYVDLKIFPNPTKDFMSVFFGESDENLIELFNSNGQLVYKQIVKNTHPVDMQTLLPGIYILKASNKKNVAFERIIKL